MKQETFDHLTRHLSATRSRRGALSLFVAGAMAPLLSRAASGAQTGKRGEGRAKAPRGNQCDVCDNGCRYDKLQPAIDAAKAGDTITVCEGTYKSNPTIYINKPLTVVGAGADDTEMKGGGFVRVLMIGPSGVVTLRGLTITGGKEDKIPRLGGAGILLLDKGKLTLEDCVVEKNDSAEGGGIVVSPGSELHLVRSSVNDNSAFSVGGGIIVKAGGRATLDAGSSVSDNKSKVWGGGIYVAGGTLVLESGSLIEKNKARLVGGGIYAGSGSSVTLASGSRVTANDAGDMGGGIFGFKSTITLADTAIVAKNDPNNCAGMEIANCIG